MDHPFCSSFHPVRGKKHTESTTKCGAPGSPWSPRRVERLIIAHVTTVSRVLLFARYLLSRVFNLLLLAFIKFMFFVPQPFPCLHNFHHSKVVATMVYALLSLSKDDKFVHSFSHSTLGKRYWQEAGFAKNLLKTSTQLHVYFRLPDYSTIIELRSVHRVQNSMRRLGRKAPEQGWCFHASLQANRMLDIVQQDRSQASRSQFFNRTHVLAYMQLSLI